MNKDVIFSLSRTVQTTNVSPNTPSETQRQLSSARGKVGTGEKRIWAKKTQGQTKKPLGTTSHYLTFYKLRGHVLKPEMMERRNAGTPERRNAGILKPGTPEY